MPRQLLTLEIREVTEGKKESLFFNCEVTKTRNELMKQVSFRKEIDSTKRIKNDQQLIALRCNNKFKHEMSRAINPM